MAVEFRDYYETLGVGRQATKDEIRKFYRRLARTYHPDVNPGDKAAEERFKDIQEAYAVLSNPENRKRYDQLGSNWSAGSEFTPPPGWQTFRMDLNDLGDVFGGSTRGRGFSNFFESFFGGTSEVPPATAKGADTEAEVLISLEEANQGGKRSLVVESHQVCPACGGSGSKTFTRCSACGGQGRRRQSRRLTVSIPKGVRDGSVLRLAGRGEAVAGNGRAGDLFLRIRLRPHSKFSVVDQDDLQLELPISPWEAALGAKVKVPTLDGDIEMTIPAGAQNGQRLRLRNRGLQRRQGGRGDEYVRLKIVLPTKLSAREKELIRQWASISRFNPRES